MGLRVQTWTRMWLGWGFDVTRLILLRKRTFSGHKQQRLLSCTNTALVHAIA